MSATFVPSAAPWPPPPDLASLRELVRTADPEGLIAEGSPADEYDPEEEAIFNAIAHLPTANITPTNLLPIIEPIWHKSFPADQDAPTTNPALQSLAEQIAHFFGPEAEPLVR